MKSRTVTPLALMIDVFVELERLKTNLETVRENLVVNPDNPPDGLLEAQYHCRRIADELRSIRSLTRASRPAKPVPPKPKGPPDLKVV
jgi:hypothetical protein